MDRREEDYKEALFIAVATLTGAAGRVISSQGELSVLDNEAVEQESRLCRQSAAGLLGLLGRIAGYRQTYSSVGHRFDDVDAWIDNDEFWY